MSEEIYIANIKNGPYRAYFEDGKLQEEGEYKNDLKDGTWKSYNKEGEMVNETKYKKGEAK
jgi:antitoxin component YwqK of YwqJK toxin-antitoxin module